MPRIGTHTVNNFIDQIQADPAIRVFYSSIPLKDTITKSYYLEIHDETSHERYIYRLSNHPRSLSGMLNHGSLTKDCRTWSELYDALQQDFGWVVAAKTESVSIIKQILGEDIPGSEDTDVTGDEFLQSGPRTIDHGHGVTQVYDEDGTEFWYRNGRLHRDNDLPAMIYNDGSKVWYRNGLRYRDGDKPAYIGRDGGQAWWVDGNLHRDGDKPVIVTADGSQYWYRNGLLHRDGDKPAIIHSDGSQEWYRNGKRVR